MKSSTFRSRALRAAVGGLLMSSLSESELKRVARELDFEFLAELREMLLALPFRPELYQDDSYGQRSGSDLAASIYERGKAKRMSKERMLSYMREVDSAAAGSVSTETGTLRDLVESFLARVGTEGAARLLGRLAGQLEQDPYLTGISERK